MLVMVPDVPLGFYLKCLPAGSGTEVIGFTLISEFIGGGHAADFHAADRVLKAAIVFIVLLLFHPAFVALLFHY